MSVIICATISRAGTGTFLNVVFDGAIDQSVIRTASEEGTAFW
jgi:hypothetical protein